MASNHLPHPLIPTQHPVAPSAPCLLVPGPPLFTVLHLKQCFFFDYTILREKNPLRCHKDDKGPKVLISMAKALLPFFHIFLLFAMNNYIFIRP